MKSYFFYLLFFLSLGCLPPEETQEQQTSLEDIQLRFEPLSVAEEDLNQIKLICSALEDKEIILPDLVGQRYNFTYFQKSCESSEYAPEQMISALITKPSQQYVFKNEDGGIFPFPDLETTVDGVMKPICAQLSDLKSPLQISSRMAMWFTTFTSEKHCKSDKDAVCIQIQKGEYLSDLNYKIHTSEWIKFKVRSNLLGFFIERKLNSRLGCTPGRIFEKKVLLTN